VTVFLICKFNQRKGRWYDPQRLASILVCTLAEISEALFLVFFHPFSYELVKNIQVHVVGFGLGVV
jgi:hypothetical protein